MTFNVIKELHSKVLNIGLKDKPEIPIIAISGTIIPNIYADDILFKDTQFKMTEWVPVAGNIKQ